jgi:hypothetical protein
MPAIQPVEDIVNPPIPVENVTFVPAFRGK